MRVFAAASVTAAALTFAAHASNQSNEPNVDSRSAQFLQTKAEAQRRFSQALPGNADVPGLTALAKAVQSSVSASQVVPAAQRANFQESLYRDIAIELAALGFSPGDIRAASGGGDAIVRAAANKVIGTPTIQDLVLLADTVVIGRVVRVELANTQYDGFGGIAEVEVAEAIKGRARVGDRISVLLRSGQIGERLFVRDSAEHIPQTGQTVALIGSSASYGPQARFRGRAPGNRRSPVVKLANLMDVEGDRLRSHDWAIPDARRSDLAR